MVVRYRTTGPWGAGTGANLSPAQVDESFFTLAEQIASFSAPVGVGVATIEVVGNKMTIHLTDSSTQGPFILPSASFTDTGDWAPDTDYQPMDIFLVPNIGLYLVAALYHSDSEFDPDVMDTDGNKLLKLIIQIPPMPDTSALVIMDVDVDFYDVNSGDAGKYVRVTGATTTTDDDVIPINVMADMSEVGEGFWQTFRQAGNRQLEVVAVDTSVVINTAETLKTRKQHSTFTLIHLGSNVWDLTGDLEPA